LAHEPCLARARPKWTNIDFAAEAFPKNRVCSETNRIPYGSNPARTYVIWMAHPGRAEIFALPEPMPIRLELLGLLPDRYSIVRGDVGDPGVSGV